MNGEKQSSFAWFVSQAFGSDELTPYTAEYSWNSNQMAHTMMGFCLAMFWLLSAVLLKAKSATNGSPGDTPGAAGSGASPNGTLARLFRWMRKIPLVVYAITLFATIPLKEVADMLLDGANYANSPVDPNTRRLAFDSVTDISFWWTGMFLAAAAVGAFVRKDGRYRLILPLVGLGACIAFWYFFAATLWLNQKRTFDKSGMPFNYTRLVVLAGERDGPRKVSFAGASPTKWPDLEDFRGAVVNSTRPPQRHYVLFGGHPDTRSRLAVSMGCEYAFKIRRDDTRAEGDDFVKIRYFSAATALERPTLLEEDSTLKKLECVVIDHLDVSMTRPSEARAEIYFGIKEQQAEKSPNKTVAIPPRVFDKYKLAVPPGSKIPPKVTGDDRIHLPLSSLAALKREAIANEKETVGPSPAPKLQSERWKAISALGDKADRGAVSTIWVLTGYDGGKDEHAKKEWVKRKDDWVNEIAEIVRVKKETLKLIELAEVGP